MHSLILKEMSKMRTAVEALSAISVGYIIGYFLIWLLVADLPYPGFDEHFATISAGIMLFLYAFVRVMGVEFRRLK